MTFWDMTLFILVVFVLVAALVILLWILGDVITDSGLSGWAKALWVLVVIVFPVAGSVVYLVVRGSSMSDRRAGSTRGAWGGTNADLLMSSGAITGSTYSQLRAQERR